jgi:hypothetical protein
MCIRVQYQPLQQLREPWDADRNLITLPAGLDAEFTMRALRMLLRKMDVEQPERGARCWCGEQIGLLPRIPQQRSNEVSHLGA